MQKRIAVLLILAMLASLCACGQEKPSGTTAGAQGVTTAPDSAVTPSTQPDAVQTDAPTTKPEEEIPDGCFAFTVEGVDLIPGQVFDPDALPEAEFTYQVPSCAFEGTDNVYSYGGFEVTAYSDGEQEFIYSIYLIDPNLTTQEGLALGDPAERVIELYGQNYTETDTQWEYRRSDTMLYVIIQNDCVASIEFCMAQ